MKKGLVIKTPLLLVMGGLLILMVFFIMYGGSGLVTEGFSQGVPNLINEIVDQYNRRSPSANSAYVMHELSNAFSFSKETPLTDINCFFRLNSANSRMVNGYISLKNVGDEIEFFLNPQNPDDLDDNGDNNNEYDELQKYRQEGKLCLIHGAIANELKDELNKHNRARRIANSVIDWIAFWDDVGFIELQNNYYSIEELNIRMGSNGLEEIVIDNKRYHISEYMVYVNGEVCFIPLSIDRPNLGDCDIEPDGAMNIGCNRYFGRNRFSCNG